jgi:hypothetical protein
MSETPETPDNDQENAGEKQHRTRRFSATRAKQQYEAYKTKAYTYAKEYFSRPWWFQETDAVAKFTGWVAIFTLALVIVAFLQTCTLTQQLTEMRAEQRPWITIAIAPGSNLTHADNGAPKLIIATMMKNIGHLPAQHVAVASVVVPWADISHLAAERDSVCNFLKDRKLTSANEGFVLFPNDVKQPPMYRQMSDENYAKWKSSGQPFVIAGCLDYVFLTDGSHHHVGFLIEIDKKGPADHPIQIIGPADNVSQGDLLFEENSGLPWDID